MDARDATNLVTDRQANSFRQLDGPASALDDQVGAALQVQVEKRAFQGFGDSDERYDGSDGDGYSDNRQDGTHRAPPKILLSDFPRAHDGTRYDYEFCMLLIAQRFNGEHAGSTERWIQRA